MMPSLLTLLPYWVSSLCPPGSAILNLFYHFHQHCHRSCYHKSYPFYPFSTILSNVNLLTSFYCFKFLKSFPIKKNGLPTRTYETPDLTNLPDSCLSLAPSPSIYILCSLRTKLFYFLFPWYARISQPRAFGLAFLPAHHLSPPVSFPTSISSAKRPCPLHISILSFLTLLTFSHFLDELKDAEGYRNQSSSFWHKIGTW